MRDWLFNARKSQSLTLKEAGKKLGVSESYYLMIENGERKKVMDMALIYKISENFNIPIAKIFEYENFSLSENQ